MAVQLDIAAETLRSALEVYQASLKRALNTARYPAFKPIIEKDLELINRALGSIVEIKLPK